MKQSFECDKKETFSKDWIAFLYTSFGVFSPNAGSETMCDFEQIFFGGARMNQRQWAVKQLNWVKLQLTNRVKTMFALLLKCGVQK